MALADIQVTTVPNAQPCHDYIISDLPDLLLRMGFVGTRLILSSRIGRARAISVSLVGSKISLYTMGWRLGWYQ